MKPKMGVLVIHGIGMQDIHFADKMINELRNRIQKVDLNPNHISFKPVFWAPVLQKKEERLWCTLEKNNDLKEDFLRKLVISYLGDAVAYNQRDTKTKPNVVYHSVHEKLHDQLLELKKNDFNNQDLPLVLMGHSLGCHIISNYIWDRQNWNAAQRGKDPFGSTKFEKMETLIGIISFGCNIPLFTLALSQVKSITFPPLQLPKELKQVARWMNFYDPDDVLGYPLKPIYNNHAQLKLTDIPINVGSILTSWNPMSHLGYWTDNDFTKPVSEFLCTVLSEIQ
jgi:hypothetical protein